MAFFWRAGERQHAQHLRAVANREDCGKHASDNANKGVYVGQQVLLGFLAYQLSLLFYLPSSPSDLSIRNCARTLSFGLSRVPT
jgi:hypothetical protein